MFFEKNILIISSPLYICYINFYIIINIYNDLFLSYSMDIMIVMDFIYVMIDII